MRLLYCLLALTILSPCLVFSQKTTVYGRVVEATTGSPVSFANVFCVGTTAGAYTDELGNYLVDSPEKFDSIRVSALGYQDTVLAVKIFQKQEINIRLKSTDYTLGEVVVHAGENPAFEVLRNVVKHKKENDPEKFTAYEYRSYNKVQFDLNNFTDKIKKNFLFKPFPFVWQFQDSLANGVRYLPFMFKENVRQHYYRKKPKAYREYVIGEREAQFFKGPKSDEFISELYLNPNVYENFVVILDKSFPSPINDNFKRHYKYFLADTLTMVDGLPCYYLRFAPTGASDVAFTGSMFIHDSTYAVKRVELNFSIEANVNFVRSFYVRIDYDWLGQKHWFAKEFNVLADFTAIEHSAEMTGFFGHRHSELKDIVVDQPREDEIYSPIEQVIETDSVRLRDEAFWLAERGDTLSQEERDIFYLVDTIQRNKKFKLIKKTFSAIGTGWIPFKYYDIGQLFTFYSYNDVEGSRLKFGFRTPKKSTFPLQATGYAAYGTRDERWKFNSELNWVFGQRYKRHTLVGASWKKDVNQLGRSYRAIALDHVFTYFLQLAPFDTRTFEEYQSAHVEREWFLGFVTRAAVFRQNVAPFGDYNFLNSEGGVVPSFDLSGWKVSGRLAYGEKGINARFYDPDNVFFMLRYPVVSFDFTAGIKDFLDGGFNYQRLSLRVEHQQRLNKWGYLAYMVEGGKIWGTVPYPFLAIPFGNQAVLADKASFNMMNYLEFASDEYVALHLEHHFEGLFFNKIPGVRKLKLRELVFGKVFAGRLSAKNDPARDGRWQFPERLHPIQEPYVEIGFGIENIIKLGRVDFTWRLNYLDHEDTYRFLPKPSFQFRF